jgi:hypothetical protein
LRLRAVLHTTAHETSTSEKLKSIVEHSLMSVSQLGDSEADRLRRRPR